jgi:hypothetical protein
VAFGVVPASWMLPRAIEFTTVDGRRLLSARPPDPPGEEARVARTGDSEWRIVLPWSEEALASPAYEMTFWYMAKIGEVLYRGSAPKGWSDMSPGEARPNAVKMMLYYLDPPRAHLSRGAKSDRVAQHLRVGVRPRDELLRPAWPTPHALASGSGRDRGPGCDSRRVPAQGRHLRRQERAGHQGW